MLALDASIQGQEHEPRLKPWTLAGVGAPMGPFETTISRKVSMPSMSNTFHDHCRPDASVAPGEAGVQRIQP